ncbi:MAG: transglycosylase SLT domain-containing protein [Pseudomonadota bacterium]
MHPPTALARALGAFTSLAGMLLMASAHALTSDQAWQQFLADETRHLPASGYPYQHCFAESARRYDLPEALLLAVGRGESALDPLARSHANAYGLMQIQWPGTAKHLGIHSVRTLLNPCRNVDAGARYLRELLGRYGSLERALAAYNVGPGRVSERADVPLPGAGHRYSQYIYRQLAKGGDRASPPPLKAGKAPASPTAPTARAYPQTHHLVVFDSPVRAHSLAHALSRRYPQLDVSAQRLDARNFAVTVVLASEATSRASREALRRAGFELP